MYLSLHPLLIGYETVMQLVWDDEQIQIMYDKFLYHTSWSLYSYPIHYPSEDFPTC